MYFFPIKNVLVNRVELLKFFTKDINNNNKICNLVGTMQVFSQYSPDVVLLFK